MKSYHFRDIFNITFWLKRHKAIAVKKIKLKKCWVLQIDQKVKDSAKHINFSQKYTLKVVRVYIYEAGKAKFQCG